MAEGVGLENQCVSNGTKGSNPLLSATSGKENPGTVEVPGFFCAGRPGDSAPVSAPATLLRRLRPGDSAPATPPNVYVGSKWLSGVPTPEAHFAPTYTFRERASVVAQPVGL